MKNSELAKNLRQHFSDKQEFTTKEVNTVLQRYFPELNSSTIAWKLNQLKNEKLLFQTGRGIYTFDYKPEFTPELSLKSKRLYNRVKAIYSKQVVMWETLQLSKIEGKEIAKHWVFLAIDKGDLDLLFNEMLSFSKKVFLHPDKETTARYLLPQEEAIVLTALLSETPIERFGEFQTLTLEGILVNAWFEHEQYLKPIGLDITKLYQKAFTNYNVNKSKLLRYAARRDKREEINELLKSIE